MLASQIPAKVPLPFANSGTKNTIPTASQIGITPGAASLTDGFPPLTFTPLASGGVPPAGADFNGVFNLITAVLQWQCAGGTFKYDSAFSTSIGGYPKGAVLISTSNDTNWLNLADNNTTDPDGVSAVNWAPIDAYGITAITGLTNANVTLTTAQSSKPIVSFTGTLTGNVQIILPTSTQQWLMVNNTTGAFSLTVKTSSGSGIAIAQGSPSIVFGDGTNIVAVLAGYLPLTGGTMTGVLKMAKGAAIASAATVDLSAATGNYLHISGSTGPVTSFGTVAAGTTYFLVCDSTPTFTYNAASMILSGAASYTASAGDLLVAISEGSGNWKVTIIKADGTPVSGLRQQMKVQDQKASGTGAQTGTAGAYVTRTLNTVVSNTITGASLTSNQISLPAGTYTINARAPCYRNDGSRIKLQNITDSTVTFLGSGCYSFNSGSTSADSLIINARFVIAATKVFEIQHFVQTAGAMGQPATSGDVEIYTDVTIVREM